MKDRKTGIRIGNGYDVHAIKEGLPMWLCGVQVESKNGFVAHSDGDVAIHALCYSIENVDITIALQEPKLRPYINIMRETLAKTMGIDIQQVSVKATTTERLGFVGRGEGCEVWATVLLTRKRTDNQ